MWIVVDMIESVVRVISSVGKRCINVVISMGITMWGAIYMAVKQLPIVVVRSTVVVPVVVPVAVWIVGVWLRIGMRIRIFMRITVAVNVSTVDMW